MKQNLKVVAVFAVAMAVAGTAQAAGKPPAADSLIAAAQKAAKREHKNVMVLFHATW